MAQKVQVLLVDDLDGSEATETVAFGLDGAAYEIDLSSGNAGKLRKELAHYVEHARKRVLRLGVAGRALAPGVSAVRKSARGPSSAATRSMSAAAFRRTSSRSTKPRTSPRAPEFAGVLAFSWCFVLWRATSRVGRGEQDRGVTSTVSPAAAAVLVTPPRRARGRGVRLRRTGRDYGNTVLFHQVDEDERPCPGTSWVCVTHTWGSAMVGTRLLCGVSRVGPDRS